MYLYTVKLHNNLGGWIYHILWLSHARHANEPIITFGVLRQIKKTVIFCAITQRVVVIPDPLKKGPTGCPKTSVRNCHYCLRNSAVLIYFEAEVWNYASSKKSGHPWSRIHGVHGSRMNSMEHKGNGADWRKPTYLEETCPTATLSATNHVQTILRSNKGLRSEKLVTALVLTTYAVL